MSECRAAVFNGDGTYEVRPFPIPKPGPGGAVLRVEAVGMCGSDVAQLNGHHHVLGEVALIVPGHETGTNPRPLPRCGPAEVGDRVAVEIMVLETPSEKNPTGIVAGYSYTLGVDHEHGLWGGYGEYMGLIPGTRLHKLTDDLPASELTLFEGLASAVNWVDVADVRRGDTVVVQGPGHMGLCCIVMAKLRGAGRVIVTGTSHDAARFEIARAIGADDCIDVIEEDVVSRVREITGGAMARVVMDMAAVATSTVPEGSLCRPRRPHLVRRTQERTARRDHQRPPDLPLSHDPWRLRLDERVGCRGVSAPERGAGPGDGASARPAPSTNSTTQWPCSSGRPPAKTRCGWSSPTHDGGIARGRTSPGDAWRPPLPLAPSTRGDAPARGASIRAMGRDVPAKSLRHEHRAELDRRPANRRRTHRLPVGPRA